jgi:hypothetical protein
VTATASTVPAENASIDGEARPIAARPLDEALPVGRISPALPGCLGA